MDTFAFQLEVVSGVGSLYSGKVKSVRVTGSVRELCAAATAEGYPFDADEQIARIRLHLQKAPDGFTSIYADLKAGRRTEVDVINGAVVAAGRRHNIPVPTHEFVVELVHAMETRA